MADNDTACCCLPAEPAAPALIWNRPGLDRLDWRVGTFASFRRTLLERIALEPALAALTTRESDDHAITLLELAAAVADVLAFYTERLGNEFYLRTARERDSVLRLVRLIGYELHPGLAATAQLAITLDDGARTRIRRGFPVMSVPGQDELPQTYETLAEIIADARLNAAPAFAAPRPLNAFGPGVTGGLLTSRPADLGVRDGILLFGAGTVEEKTVAALSATPAGERLVFTPAVQATLLSSDLARAARIQRRLRFFGANSPASHNVYNPNPAIPPSSRWTSVAINTSLGANLAVYPLDTRLEDLKAGARLLIDSGPGASPRLATAVVASTEDGPETLGPLSDTVTRVALRQTARGMPALAASGGAIHAVIRSGAGHLLAFTPSGWTPLDLAAWGNPALVSPSLGRLDLFARAVDRSLHHATFTGTWSGFASLGGILTSDPVPLALSGELHVFGRGLDNALWTRRILPGPTPWSSLGGIVGPEIAVVASSPSVIDVFARGLDRQLWHRRRSAGLWEQWQPLGGSIAHGPAAASPSPGRLDVAIDDDEGRISHRRFDEGRWLPWIELGGPATGTPALAATGADRVDVFIRTPGGTLRHIAHTAATWSQWTHLEGTIASDPRAIVNGATLHVEARAQDGTLAHRALAGASWGGWSSRPDFGLSAIPDRRRARIWELGPQDIVFEPRDYPATVESSRLALRLAGEVPPELVKGRLVMIQSDGVSRAAVITAAAPAAPEIGAAPDHIVLDFAPPLPAPATDVRLLGNIVPASHGETQREETLGHGDGARTFQKLRLANAPLTYLPGAALRPSPALELRVSGELWSEVPSLYARGPTERIYTARRADDGQTTLTFGDGITGARLPAGAGNVVARYRKGVGLAGRVRAGQLATPLERPVGLRGVANPLASDGGAGPETRDDARAAAPGTVRTFGRAVSLDDFSHVAIASGLVARAEATWVWRRLERTVHLTIAGPDGVSLSKTALAQLYAAFGATRDPNRELFLANLVRVPLTIAARIVPDPAYEPEAVLAAAGDALVSAYSFAAVPLGRAVHASAAYAALQSAPGVLAVDLELFHLRDHTQLSPAERAVRSVTAAPVQPHIRIYPARPAPADPTLIDRYARAGFDGPPPPVLAAEQAYLANPAKDLRLMLVGAL